MARVSRTFADAANGYLRNCIPEAERDQARSDLAMMYEESQDREGFAEYLRSEARSMVALMQAPAEGITARVAARKRDDAHV